VNYLPLRVHSIFSRGRGAVTAAELALYLRRQGLPYLAVCDPLSVIAWEYFREEAERNKLAFVPGLEVNAGRSGEILVFPVGKEGLPTLLGLHNGLESRFLESCKVILLPALQDEHFIERTRERVAPGKLYLGLTWKSRRWLVTVARSRNLPLVWANPCCWLADSARYRAVASVFRHLPWPEAARMDVRLEGPIPAAAIIRRWGEAGREALANTLCLARDLDFSFRPRPPASPGNDPELHRLVVRKLEASRATAAERKRALRELQIINGLSAGPVFLIAATVASFCRSKGIYFNLRGSAAASFVLYLLGLSRCHPLHYGLVSERFLNSLRDDLPDIDIDIEAARREEVLLWMAEHYRGRAAFISSHKFFGARSALYDTARAFGYSAAEALSLTRRVNMFATPADLLSADCAPAEITQAAALLEGVFRELSLHVGGVIFTPGSVSRDFPLESSAKTCCQTVWDRKSVERLRIFKIDLLSVRGFTVISPQALQKMPARGHAETWQTIAAARTIGCFQLESPLARENLLAARPADLADLAACLAVIRPGPARSGMKKAYLGRQKPMHPLLGRLFPHTRGTLLYEEQVSLLLHETSGWSLEKAEKIRLLLKRGPLAAEEEEYLVTGLSRGWLEKELRLFWKLAADFSQYAFCQAHSVSFAYSAYLSAWLKTNEPLTFFCRLFNAAGGYYPLPVYVEEARRSGLTVLPPDVNQSRYFFQVEAGALRTGLCFVRGIGRATAAKVIQNRGNGFTDITDFLFRARCTEKETALLMSAGVFETLGCSAVPPETNDKWRVMLGFQPGPPTS